MRYARQTALAEVGLQGQQKIRESSVLVVGAGGLGSPVLQYLAGAGVGRIGIIDHDTVSMSNLQRQVLYTESQIGQNKAMCAKQRLNAINSECDITAYPFALDADNARRIISGYEIIVDGCDNFATRYLISDICDRLRKPYVYGAIGEFNGQVSTFCRESSDGRYRTYRDVFPAPASVPQHSKAVLGVTPGVVGCVQACETLKLICGFGDNLCAKMWIMDLKTMNCVTIDL